MCVMCVMCVMSVMCGAAARPVDGALRRRAPMDMPERPVKAAKRPARSAGDIV